VAWGGLFRRGRSSPELGFAVVTRKASGKKIKPGRDLLWRQRPFYRPTWAAAFILRVQEAAADPATAAWPRSSFRQEEDDERNVFRAGLWWLGCWAILMGFGQVAAAR
jgi:hypothetical protein